MLKELRSLAGLSLEQCAQRLGVASEEVTSAERGEDDVLAARLAELYAVDPDQLQEGLLTPVAGVEAVTVFLLQGAYQDFYAEDLSVLDRAMRAGRLVAGLDGAADRATRRLQFVPTSPTGPRPADAARQGHKLAGLVRARLGLGSDPLPDLRVLLEEQLGIAVVLDALTDLRAASVLDAGRAAAAVVLADTDPHLTRNSLLARVYLTHELCHLLFDPTAPGRVRITLDDRDGELSDVGNLAIEALLEARAKGFAAELLMPLAGLTVLLGPAQKATAASMKRSLVQRVCANFGTPWEIASNHLSNHGFIASRKVVRPTGGWLEERLVGHTTSLPDHAAPPRILGTDLAPVLLAEITDAPPDYVQHARSQAADVAKQTMVQMRNAMHEDLQGSRPIAAVDRLARWLDDMMYAGEFELIETLLGELDPKDVPPSASTAALALTRPVRAKVNPGRQKLLDSLEDALLKIWGVDETLARSTVERLA
ncbi:MAG: helix-turn-helix transcriptional regulator [Deltaproteobacteria bacterium]|nr:helix-turn-helix transcriptional regulator [Deltaproteobacteria bacterium]